MIFSILKDISVEQGSIIPWFNQPGQGTQIMFSEDIEELIKEGKIEIRNLKEIK
ncbi:glycohydrolase toxin TNT-related protein [Segatella salivae]|uniref:glycohydrolase toxin TNT-related protein n=1 Tax=Segatella salivae TaxID=228604 RepID=UPI003C6FD4CA